MEYLKNAVHSVFASFFRFHTIKNSFDMLPPDLLDRFTTHLKEALQKALHFAVTHGRSLVEPGDLLVGLVLEKGSIGAEILQKNHVTPERAETSFHGIPGPTTPIVTPDLSPAVKRIVEKCVLTAHLHEHKYIGTEHLLSALLESGCEDLTSFFESCNVKISALREQVLQALQAASRFPELTDVEETEEVETSRQESSHVQPQRHARITALEAFTRDLTTAETAQTLDPVIGRERELERAIEILCRRNKNNPMLLGDPGVGKTAIVEGLAKRLAAGEVPDILCGKRLLTLDLAMIVAGTMYRGEFEARLKHLMEEVKQDPNVILFIDEIHNLVGAGSTTGSLDAANILKPALARGEIRCIGATTWTEYKKYIEPDAALERRFQPIAIDEPSLEMTLDILNGLEIYYAKYHHVRYAKDVSTACARLAERYLTDRCFPDKAIDLLDEAAAAVNARTFSRKSTERLSALQRAITAADEHASKAVAGGRLEEADMASIELKRLRLEYEAFKSAADEERVREMQTVTAADVAVVVARMAGIPLARVLETEREQLSTLHQKLSADIFGEEKAMRAVAELVYRARLGLSDPRRPRSAMLFAGPSGTGKTETARILARELFGTKDALIKLDMSEFSEPHTMSKLIGSPAGYVGYRDATKLTDMLRKRPHAVVLFDEIEKAHPDVQHLLLQILEDGAVSDGTGRSVSFRHAFVVLTSNVGGNAFTQKNLGFETGGAEFETMVAEELRQRFRPELLNRLDRIVVFHPLTQEPLKALLHRELQHILERVQHVQRVACSAPDEALEWLLAQPLPPEEGARAVRRLLEREVTALIGTFLSEKPQAKRLKLKVTPHGLKVV